MHRNVAVSLARRTLYVVAVLAVALAGYGYTDVASAPAQGTAPPPVGPTPIVRNPLHESRNDRKYEPFAVVPEGDSVSSLAANLLVDPSFEVSLGSSAYWSQFSTNFGSPLCNFTCEPDEINLARTGSIWVWFGGTPNDEVGWVQQTVTIPTGTAALKFNLWFYSAAPGSDANDYFAVKMDGTTVFSVNATQILSYPDAYTLVTVDVSAYADGASHTVQFYSSTTGQNVSIMIDDVSLTAGVFYDVPVVGKEWMEPWIVAFYNAGVTTGCGVSPLRYCPENQVTRAEMAVFLLRAIHGAAYVPPDPTHDFADVPVTGKEWMEPWIEQFYAEGVTTGCGGGNYCPENKVTRAEMAVFVLRALNGGSHVPPAASGVFVDVPVAGKEWMEPWIIEFYNEGITTGCGAAPLRYCPENNVTRAEMAVFIDRAYGLYPP